MNLSCDDCECQTIVDIFIGFVKMLRNILCFSCKIKKKYVLKILEKLFEILKINLCKP